MDNPEALVSCRPFDGASRQRGLAFFVGDEGLTVGEGHFPPQMVGIGHSGDGGVGDGVEQLSQS